jgi:energy-coupling factor transporter ATP-binding protein EcfA2
MLKLRRLRVEKFRNLARGAELFFSDGINVLLGQNGTGKTTLLELISMVVRSDFSSLAEEEFAIEYEMVVGEVVISVSLRNQRQDASDPLPRQETWWPSMSARVIATNGSEISLRVDNGRLHVNEQPVDEQRMGHLLSRGTIALYVVEHGLRAVLGPMGFASGQAHIDVLARRSRTGLWEPRPGVTPAARARACAARRTWGATAGTSCAGGTRRGCRSRTTGARRRR